MKTVVRERAMMQIMRCECELATHIVHLIRIRRQHVGRRSIVVRRVMVVAHVGRSELRFPLLLRRPVLLRGDGHWRSVRTGRRRGRLAAARGASGRRRLRLRRPRTGQREVARARLEIGNGRLCRQHWVGFGGGGLAAAGIRARADGRAIEKMNICAVGFEIQKRAKLARKMATSMPQHTSWPQRLAAAAVAARDASRPAERAACPHRRANRSRPIRSRRRRRPWVRAPTLPPGAPREWAARTRQTCADCPTLVATRRASRHPARPSTRTT